MSAKCAQNELEMSAKCAQNEPQVRKGKDSIDKESKGKLGQDKMTLRYFLDTHNLSSIDKRYEQKLTTFFHENNKDILDCLNYCEYVFSYLKVYHDTVDAQLFFSVSLKSDVLSRFYNSKPKEKKNTSYDIWLKICPVCGRNHFKNQENGHCPLDMSKENSAETIKAARITFEKYEMEAFKIVHSMNKLQTKGVN